MNLRTAAILPRRPGRVLSVLLVTIAAVCLSPAGAALADSIFSFVDKNGVRHFTNAPTDERFKLYKEWRPPTRPSVGTYHGLTYGGGVRRSYKHIPAIYNRYVIEAANRYGVDADLIRAVMQVESNCNRYAVSRSGARGLMQLMPTTAQIVRVRNSFDAKDNIRGGTEYLRYLLDTFNNDLSLSLAAYNAGPTLVGQLGRIPAIPETRDYVIEVTALYTIYHARSREASLDTTASKRK